MKKNILIITGGTGGHVLPAINLANFFHNKNINCRVLVDKRGFKYVTNFKGKVHIINSSNLSGNIFSKILGLLFLSYGFIQSLIIILFFKPKIVISFGSYASFFPMISCIIFKSFLKTKLFIHEQNSILGRTNKIFLNFSDRIFLNFDISLKINSKFQKKLFVVGLPEKKYDYSELEKYSYYNKKFTILIMGGSQGSEFISKFSSKLIKIIDDERKLTVRFIFQCPKNILNNTINNLIDIKSELIIKDYFSNIDEILNETTVAISRAGAGSINDFINYNIPSILIPLPTAKDNHQYYNASILEKEKVAIILDQSKNELEKAKNYIYNINDNLKNLKKISDRFNKIRVKNSNSLIYKLITND